MNAMNQRMWKYYNIAFDGNIMKVCFDMLFLWEIQLTITLQVELIVECDKASFIVDKQILQYLRTYK